jgi:hypothetical protein
MISVEYLENQRAGTATDHLFFLLSNKPPSRFLPIVDNFQKTIIVSISRTAELAIRALLPEDRKAVETSIHRLRISPPLTLSELNDPTTVQVRRAYVRHVANLTMVIFRTGNEFVVEDIFLQSRLPRIVGELKDTHEDISHT